MLEKGSLGTDSPSKGSPMRRKDKVTKASNQFPEALNLFEQNQEEFNVQEILELDGGIHDDRGDSGAVRNGSSTLDFSPRKQKSESAVSASASP